MVGLTVLTPALPLIKDELGASSSAVQQLLTAYMIAMAAGQLIYGPVSDRVGRRPILLLGALLFTVGGVLAVFIHDIFWMTLLRMAQGLGAAACMAMSRAMVNDAFTRDDAARHMSLISTLLAVAPALSIAFGGVLAESTGWQGIMILLSIIGIVMLSLAYYFAYETNFQKLQTLNLTTVLSAYSQVLSNRIFLCWTMAGGLQIGMFFSLNAFLAYQYQRHGYSLAEFGYWFSLTPLFYLIGNVCNRRWFVAKGLERAALIGVILSLLSSVSLYVTQAMGYTHALSLALPCCLFGFGNGITVANVTMGALDAAGKHAGTGSGIVGSWQMASGGIAGALIVALGGDEIFSIAAGGLVVMSLLSVMCMYIVFNNRKKAV
ncbi:MAG: multidrug effflux MFS transporter [Gammaproteobacteria bacterium]|nr:multidrug effflux MFS transporter [Gammaproteobacteria bacterium]